MDFFSMVLVPVIIACIIFYFIYYFIKACKTPKFEEIPVTGHPSGLSVIPVSINGHFLKSESTVLKLCKENTWSGDDCTVKVLISV